MLNRRTEVIVFYNKIENKSEEPCEGTYIKVLSRWFPVDLDNDGETDFTLNYNSVGNGRQGIGSLSGSITSNHGFRFLNSIDKNLLQFEKGDTISTDIPEEVKWFGSTIPVVYYDKKNNVWSTNNFSDPEIIYLALMKSENGQNTIGWLKFYFDSCTGVHELLGYRFEKGDFVVIDE